MNAFKRAWENLPEGLRFALLAYLCFRLPLELALSLAAGEIPQGPGAAGMPMLDGPHWAMAWLRWDSGWYVRIIREGFSYSACLSPTDPCGQASIAFFPGYPMAARALTWVGFSVPMASFLVTHLALIVALWGLHRLAGKFLAPEGQLRALAALLAYPLSIFLSAGYAESLLICFAVWAYVFFEEDRPLLAGLCIAAAVITRSHGTLVCAALVGGALLQRRWKMAITCALCGAAVLGSYLAWQGLTFGDPLAFSHARKAWGYVRGPWAHLSEYVASAGRGERGLEGWFDLAAIPWLFAVCGFSWRRFGAAYGLFPLAILVTMAQAGQVTALGRVSLCAIPAYLLLGEWSARPRVRMLLLTSGLCLLMVSGLRFVNGWHTGT
jgi:hypothetical protein